MARAAAVYKKKEGYISVADNRRHLFWTPSAPPNASPTVTITVSDISNLQQSPATAPKARLRVVLPPTKGSTDQQLHDFTFTSQTAAREEQAEITDILRDTIAATKFSAAPVVQRAANGEKNASGPPAALAIAHAVAAGSGSNTTPDESGWYDDSRLLADLALQRSLLESNESLRQRFTQSSQDKPSSITLSQFTTQFWSPRLHLLRAYAIENAQLKGEYNVLPELKKKKVNSTIEGEPSKETFELSKEQIKLLFRQHHVIRTAYNENVGPGKDKVDHKTFWAGFFNSRLYQKLRGKAYGDNIPSSPIFDKYLDYRPDAPTMQTSIPHFIDLEGNEQNHSQRQGNRPDKTMRAGQHEKVPVLRMLNGLSEKLIASVARSDGPAHGPIGMDEDTYNQLQLRDLQDQEGDTRVKLNIRSQQSMQPGEQDDQLSADAVRYMQQAPTQVLANLKQALSPSAFGETTDSGSGLQLDELIGGHDFEQEDLDDQGMVGLEDESTSFGRAQALNAVAKSLAHSIRTNKTVEDSGNGSGPTTAGLSQSTFDELTMTQNTTVEFLNFFWTVFLSGDGTRANELAGLVETLGNSVDRITAVADKAEHERKATKDALGEQVQAARQGSAKRRRLELEVQTLGGGKESVQDVLAPTLHSIVEAKNQYARAFDEQSSVSTAQT